MIVNPKKEPKINLPHLSVIKIHMLSENGEEWTHCAESSFLILLADGATSSFSAEDGTSSESSNKSLLMSMGLTKSKDLKNCKCKHLIYCTKFIKCTLNVSTFFSALKLSNWSTKES